MPFDAPSTRAAIIEPVGGHGGMNPYDFNLCGGLASAGVDVALFTSDVTKPPIIPHFSFRPVYRGIFGGAPKWKRALRYIRGTMSALGASVREGRRICHFHFFSVGPLEALNVLLARMLARKVVITAHDVEAFVSRLDTPGLPRFAYGLAHAVIAHNQVSREALQARIGIPPNRIHVIPAGNHINSLPELPTRADARQRLGLPIEAPLLLFFGQIKDVKGLDLLIEAMPGVLDKHPTARLLIAGRPWKTDFAQYQALIEQNRIQGACLTHIRYIPDGELPLYYQSCDLVSLPYRRIYQSDVVLMAMSMGKAVLTSDIPGMTELVKHGHTGFIFHSGDSGDLARIISDALDHPDDIQKVGAQGRQLMIDRFGWDAIGQSMARLYQSL